MGWTLALPLAQAAPGGWASTVDKVARTPQSVVVEYVLVLTAIRLVFYFLTKNVAAHRREGWVSILNFLGNDVCDPVAYAGIVVFLVIRPYIVQAFTIPSGSMVKTLLVNDFIVANKLVYRFADPKEGDIVVFQPPRDALTDLAVGGTQLDSDNQIKVDFVKRCIGVPGDTVELKSGVLYRNGKKVEEPYVDYTMATNHPDDTLFRSETDQERADDPIPDFKLVTHNGDVWPVEYHGMLVNSDPRYSAPRFQSQDIAVMKQLLDAPPAKVPPGYFLMMGDNRNNSYDGRCWGLVPRADIVGRCEWIWFPLGRFGRPQGP
jgi:signal peptidase I